MAFQFDGVNSGVQVPAAPSLDVGSGGGLTIEAWINTVYACCGQPVVEWNNGTSFGAQLWVGHPSHAPGYLFANLVDTNGGYHVVETADGLVASNSYQHLAVTYDRATGQALLYLNGAVVKQTSLGAFTPLTKYDLYIGQRPNSGFQFNGLVDEVSLYNRALSLGEIQAVYNAGSAGKCLAAAPSILAQPQNQSVRLGTNVTFTAAIQGNPPFTYQWFLNSNSIPAATNLSLTLTNVQTTNSGLYSLLVSNPFGTAASSNAQLKVLVVFAYGNGAPLTNSVQSFGGPVSIQLQTLFTNGTIFYTLDGSQPSFASTLYTAPFTLHSNAVLRALAYSSDFSQSGMLDPTTVLIVPSYTLSVTGTVGGRILLNPAGGSYLSNTLVTVTALATNGWTFLQWLGDLTGTNTTNTIAMTRTKSVQAVFGTTLNTTAAGGGSVALNPAGGLYPYGTAVRLSAIPQAGNYFAVWGNAASGNANPLTFVVTNPNPTVSSLFVAVGGGQAALTVVPVGGGGVSVSPRANVYTVGQAVSITATPGSSQSFVGWSGDASGVQNPLSVTMDQSKLIYANFTHRPALSLQPGFGGMQPEGFVLTLTGDFGATYEILGTSNFATWVSLGSATNTFGTVQFTDPTAAGSRVRFYRGLLLP